MTETEFKALYAKAIDYTQNQCFNNQIMYHVNMYKEGSYTWNELKEEIRQFRKDPFIQCYECYCLPDTGFMYSKLKDHFTK